MQFSWRQAQTRDIKTIAALHVRVLSRTLSSRLGVHFVALLYRTVARLGYVRCVVFEQKLIGALSGIGGLILTLVVDSTWQRRGVGRELFAGVPEARFVYTQQESVGFYEKMGFVRIWQLGSLIFLCRKY